MMTRDREASRPETGPEPPTRRRVLRVAGVALLAAVAAVCAGPRAGLDTGPPPAVSDRAFWTMVTEFSEPEGYFRSDNLVSNEMAFQEVIPALRARVAPGGVYLGVGPEQNFTYMVALQPRIAFIIDIRRQNMVLHLLYKALVELSADRAEFLSRLFSRPRPPGLGAASSAQALFEAYSRVAPSRALYQQNLRAVTDRLIRGHGFALTNGDLRRFEYIYQAFYDRGPDLSYSFPRQYGGAGAFRGYGGYGRRFPSYAVLMQETDGRGEQQSYLATEERFRILKDLERNNRIVPLVGNFAGHKAIRLVGTYLRERGATVTAFYTSNVEQYLFRSDDWRRFFENVTTLPIDGGSTFIRAYFHFGFRYQAGVPGPRSATLLNPMATLLDAFKADRIHTYDDVIEMSMSPASARQ